MRKLEVRKMEDLPTPLNRVELYLAKACGMDVVIPEPESRLEQFLAVIAGDTSVELPMPLSLTEQWLAFVAGQPLTADVNLIGAYWVGPQKVDVRFFAVAGGMDGVQLPTPQNRTELYWAKIAENGPSHYELVTVTGNTPLYLLDAVAMPINKATVYGISEQDGVPTPDAPVDIMCNNGILKARRQSGLPLAYQMVEWLIPTGSITITGFKTKSTQEITTVFYRERSGTSYLYSSDTSASGTTNTTAYLTTSGNWRWDGKALATSVEIGTKVTSVQSADGLYIDGTKIGSYDGGDFVSVNDLSLSSVSNTSIRIYSMTFREGGTVTLDLMPVQRLSDNVYGFYDKVSGNFYTNDEATFVAGDPIADPVEVYADGTPEKLTISGKNLFDIDTVGIEQGAIASSDGANINANYRVRTAGYVPAKPSTRYTISAVIDGYTSGASRGVFVLEYSAESAEGYLGPAGGWKDPSGYSFTTRAETRFIRIVFAKDASGGERTYPSDVSNIQLEYGNTATAYEPYTAQTASVPMLLSVGVIKDEVDLISGLLTHRIGIMVFDGSEDWRPSSSGGNIYILISAVGVNLSAICTHFQKVSNTVSSANMPDGSFRGHPSNSVLYFKDVSAGNVTDFKSWLAAQYAAGTPVIMLYTLAEETTETVTAQPMNAVEGTNIFESSLGSREAQVEYYKRAS